VFSAAGLLFTDNEHLVSRTVFRRMAEIDGAALQQLQSELEQQARVALARGGADDDAMTFQHYADLRYSGQAYELTIPIDAASPPRALAARFHAEHARTYGHSSVNDPTDLVNLKVVGRVASARADTGALSRLADGPDTAERSRTAYFGPSVGLHATPILARAALRGAPRRGPLIIEEYDATCVVPPDCTVRLDSNGNLDISLDLSS
jgi:N-methylhydantoinase A